MNLLTIIVVALILILGLIGAYRGLIRTALSLIAIIVSVIVVYIISPFVGDYVIKHTKLDDKLYDKMYSVIRTRVEENADTLAENIGIDLTHVPYLENAETAVQKNKVIAEYIMSTQLNLSDQLKVLDKIELPDFIKDTIRENNNKETYSELGADDFFQFTARYLSHTSTKIIVTFALYILCRVIFFIIIFLLTGAVRKLIIINLADKIGGGAAGLVMGIAGAWLILLFVSLVMSGTYNDLINESPILQVLDKTNVFAMRIK
ncbi:Colicin V production protein [Eubacterium ruminantium]|nr:Colicin V production protein [Eubacterium ruminantium]